MQGGLRAVAGPGRGRGSDCRGKRARAGGPRRRRRDWLGRASGNGLGKAAWRGLLGLVGLRTELGHGAAGLGKKEGLLG
jgi:hypothetical protein